MITWQRKLGKGDEVRIDNGDNEIGPSVIISEIKYLPNDVVQIITNEGEKIECLITELL